MVIYIKNKTIYIKNLKINLDQCNINSFLLCNKLGLFKCFKITNFSARHKLHLFPLLL